MHFILASLLFFASSAFAVDSTQLALDRRSALEKISFYCPIGRSPILSSVEALTIVPNAQCKFSGPLDTRIDPLSLQPPFLNPLLKIQDLKNFVVANGGTVSSDTGDSFRFQIGGGPVLTAARTHYKKLKDSLLNLRAYPPEWGDYFTTVSAARHDDLNSLVGLARANPQAGIFWTNPHYQEELAVLPRLQTPKPYLPIELVSKCGPLGSAPSPSASRSLMIVGDLHNPPQSAFFLSLLQVRKFSWVGLELGQEQQVLWQQFYDTADAGVENQLLQFFVERFPANIQDNFKNIMRALKSTRVKTVFINSYDNYFSFPYTNVSMHGLIVAARNYFWVQTLPTNWSGEAVILGGLDHFTNFPGSDFQNFASERFPGLPMTLVNPLEVCP
ncbi:MAG: hypothetical protein ACXVA9_03170 [Bdellovibrionales bacterium]